MKHFCVTWMVAACAGLIAAGCQQQSPEGDGSPAEVPQAGSAVGEEELGPPPEGQSEPPFEETQPAEPVGDEASAADPPASDVKLSMMTWDDTQQLIADKKGQVVVLDVWSTSCVPCRKEFPHFVQLHREKGDEVACISYSLDYSGRASRPPETYYDQVLEFLAEQEATFANVLSIDDPDVLLGERLDLAAPPAVYVYDRDGNLRKRFDNEDPDSEEFTYEGDVIPFVEALLAES